MLSRGTIAFDRVPCPGDVEENAVRRWIRPIALMLFSIVLPGSLRADLAWIRVIVWDEQQPTQKKACVWYSSGEQYEPNAIGYATSTDGMKWTKHADNPIFRPEPKIPWEKDRVTACQVTQGDWYVMFYIGFKNQHHAQIGVARSKDGITDWQRHFANPSSGPARTTGTTTPSTSPT
jgi:hypothetical protein